MRYNDLEVVGCSNSKAIRGGNQLNKLVLNIGKAGSLDKNESDFIFKGASII